jgi:hypothetical protein
MKERVKREVGGMVFYIPARFLVSDTIFYLPNQQEDTLRFILNPDVRLQDQILVSIDPNVSCPPLTQSEARSNCKTAAISLSNLENHVLHRIQIDPAEWQYIFNDGGQIIISCFAVGNGTDGICTHYGRYRGLPYAVHFKDSDVPKLVSIRKLIEQRLAQWESK